MHALWDWGADGQLPQLFGLKVPGLAQREAGTLGQQLLARFPDDVTCLNYLGG